MPIEVPYEKTDISERDTTMQTRYYAQDININGNDGTACRKLHWIHRRHQQRTNSSFAGFRALNSSINSGLGSLRPGPDGPGPTDGTAQSPSPEGFQPSIPEAQ